MTEMDKKKVLALICERSVDLTDTDLSQANLDEVGIIKFPCSGMIQPLMIEAALKAGASGVIVTGCQIGDCFYREGNKLIRERLLGERPPGLKKACDRRRVLGLWLSKLQKNRFLSDTKEFTSFVSSLK